MMMDMMRELLHVDAFDFLPCKYKQYFINENKNRSKVCRIEK